MKKDNNNGTKGVIYIAKTIVDGLIKIGKTQTDSFDKRMYNLEHNGYWQYYRIKKKICH